MNAVMKLVADPRSVRVCRVVIGVIFGFAGLAKLGDLRGFAEQVHNFRMLPVSLENIAAMTLPWIEVIAAIALVLGIHARAGAILASAFMSLFTVAVLAAVARGLDIECGCFGTSDASSVGWAKALQNVGMLAIALVASLRRRPGSS